VILAYLSEIHEVVVELYGFGFTSLLVVVANEKN